MAAGGSKIGIFSFARYDPEFNTKKRARTSMMDSEEQIFTANELILLQRACKILVHEIAHMYNIGHCVYAACIMNGSGNLEEDYRQPIHLCPLDLRKFQHALQFDVTQRYLALLGFFQRYGMQSDAQWVQTILERMASSINTVSDNTDTPSNNMAQKPQQQQAILVSSSSEEEENEQSSDDAPPNKKPRLN